MVETYTLERDVEIRSVGSTTFKRDDLAKGVESDDCNYIQNVEVRDDHYVEGPDSKVLPRFPIAEAIRLLKQHASIGETEMVRQFQSFVRQQVDEESTDS